MIWRSLRCSLVQDYIEYTGLADKHIWYILKWKIKLSGQKGYNLIQNGINYT